MRPTRRCLWGFGAGLPLAALPALLDAHVAALVWPSFLGGFVLALAVEFATLPRRSRVLRAVDAPSVALLGEEFEVDVSASCGSRLFVEAELEATGAVEPSTPIEFACVPGTPSVVTVSYRPRRRGLVVLVALHARWTGRLGLLWREERTPLGTEVRVLANVPAVRRRTARMIENREFSTGLKPERFVGDGSDFESLREFVAGMDRRSIDWKATARHRAVLCREFRAERDHPVMLCIDSGRLMGEPLQGQPRLDHAILAALQLAYVCLRTGDRVGMFAFADKPKATVLPQAGVHALQAIQDRLTEVDYSTEETNFTLGMTDLLRQLRRRTLVILFTDFVDSITAELMLQNVSWLARRHLLLFVAMRDPLPERLVETQIASTKDLHRAVVADEIRRERLLVLERIRRAGAQVLDTEVEHLDAGLVERYLQVKRRELL